MWHNHPTVSIGFSRVAELYPKLCSLAGAKGTHTACVCVIHQKIILMVCSASVRHILYHYTSCIGTDAPCKLLSTVGNI
jgi:hypothetical protein